MSAAIKSTLISTFLKQQLKNKTSLLHFSLCAELKFSIWKEEAAPLTFVGNPDVFNSLRIFLGSFYESPHALNPVHSPLIG